MKVLYFGAAREHSTTIQRAHALQELGYDLHIVDSLQVFDHYRGSLKRRLEVRLGRGRTFRDAGQLLLKAAEDLEPDLVWMDTGYLVPARALEILRKRSYTPLLLHYTPDSLEAPGLGHRGHRAMLRLCDVAITTKRREVSLYEALGVPRVVFAWQGYDPVTHRPMGIPSESGPPSVGFIGQYNADRARQLERIARIVPCRVLAHGPGWKGYRGSTIEVGEAVFGRDYARALNGISLPLALLNESVGDEYTTRSLEIPACGKPIVAPATRVHRRLFRDGRHGRLFSSEHELVDAIRELLSEPERRRMMGAAARRRVEELNLSWKGALGRVLRRLDITP